jgi:hypothetical protein
MFRASYVFTLMFIPASFAHALSVTCGRSVDASAGQVFETEISVNLDTFEVKVLGNSGELYVSQLSRVKRLSGGKIEVLRITSTVFPGHDTYTIDNPAGQAVVQAKVVHMDDEYNIVPQRDPLQCLVGELR